MGVLFLAGCASSADSGLESILSGQAPRKNLSAGELAEIGVVATMVGGRWVHNPPPWD